MLDGIEIYNGHANHNANNEFAALWAQKYGLTPLSGSDYHGGNTGMGTAPGGLVLKELPENEAELVKALKARQYELLC